MNLFSQLIEQSAITNDLREATKKSTGTSNSQSSLFESILEESIASREVSKVIDSSDDKLRQVIKSIGQESIASKEVSKVIDSSSDDKLRQVIKGISQESVASKEVSKVIDSSSDDKLRQVIKGISQESVASKEVSKVIDSSSDDKLRQVIKSIGQESIASKEVSKVIDSSSDDKLRQVIKGISQESVASKEVSKVIDSSSDDKLRQVIKGISQESVASKEVSKVIDSSSDDKLRQVIKSIGQESIASKEVSKVIDSSEDKLRQVVKGNNLGLMASLLQDDSLVEVGNSANQNLNNTSEPILKELNLMNSLLDAEQSADKLSNKENTKNILLNITNSENSNVVKSSINKELIKQELRNAKAVSEVSNIANKIGLNAKDLVVSQELSSSTSLQEKVVAEKTILPIVNRASVNKNYTLDLAKSEIEESSLNVTSSVEKDFSTEIKKDNLFTNLLDTKKVLFNSVNIKNENYTSISNKALDEGMLQAQKNIAKPIQNSTSTSQLFDMLLSPKEDSSNLNNVANTTSTNSTSTVQLIVDAKQGVEKFMSQLAKEMIEQYKPPMTSFKINLNPANMGSLDVMIKGNSKEVGITLNAAQISTLDILVQNQTELKNALMKQFSETSSVSLGFGMQQRSREESRENPFLKQQNKKDSNDDKENNDLIVQSVDSAVQNRKSLYL